MCAGFGYPSLSSGEEYRRWFAEAGLEVERCSDWTERVSRTWEISWQNAQRSPVHWMARLAGRERLTFWDHYLAILTAYRTGANEIRVLERFKTECGLPVARTGPLRLRIRSSNNQLVEHSRRNDWIGFSQPLYFCIAVRDLALFLRLLPGSPCRVAHSARDAARARALGQFLNESM